MPELPVHIPGLLRNCTDNYGTVTVSGETLQGCIDDLLRSYPLLKVHLFTEQGAQREHVLFYYNGENTRWLTDLNIPVKRGDEITVLQAVSGG